MSAMIWLFVVINGLISAWNSYASGMLWGHSKRTYEKVVAGAGFTLGFFGMMYTFILVFVGLGYLSTNWLIATNVFLGLPMLMAGIVVLVDSIRVAIDTKRPFAIIVAIWNSLATFWNIFVWIRSVQMFTEMGGISSLLEGENRSQWVYIAIAGLATVFISIGLFKLGLEKSGKVKQKIRR